MPMPQYPDKHHLLSLLTGLQMVDYRRKTGRFPHGDAPESVLICLETSLPARMKRHFQYRHAGRLGGDVLRLKAGGGRVAVLVNCGVGAPAVVGLAEELLGWGTRTFALLSWGGGLQPDLANGTAVVVQDAIRDDGVSPHYLPDGPRVDANKELTDRLAGSLATTGLAVRSGTSWSTSAPYRETVEEVQRYQAEGVLAVEMEAAGLLAFAQSHAVAAAAAVVVGDSLAGLTWQPPQDLDAIHRALALVYGAMLTVLLER